MEQFRELMCVPKSYQVCHITDNILKPIQNELSKYFKGLKINKIKAKKGKFISHIEFIFMAEDDMLPNGKYRIKKGKAFIEKAPTEMSQDEANKVFRDLPKTLSEKLLKEKAIEDELMMFLENLEKKAEKIANEKSKISGQIEIDV